jgi:hypothetical protein
MRVLMIVRVLMMVAVVAMVVIVGIQSHTLFFMT